jgi:hypothetical protein
MPGARAGLFYLLMLRIKPSGSAGILVGFFLIERGGWGLFRCRLRASALKLFTGKPRARRLLKGYKKVIDDEKPLQTRAETGFRGFVLPL